MGHTIQTKKRPKAQRTTADKSAPIRPTSCRLITPAAWSTACAPHNSFCLAIARIRAHLYIGHDGDEHGHDGHRGVLDGGDLGPKPFADGLLDDPLASTASRLERFPDDLADEADVGSIRTTNASHVGEQYRIGRRRTRAAFRRTSSTGQCWPQVLVPGATMILNRRSLLVAVSGLAVWPAFAQEPPKTQIEAPAETLGAFTHPNQAKLLFLASASLIGA